MLNEVGQDQKHKTCFLSYMEGRSKEKHTKKSMIAYKLNGKQVCNVNILLFSISNVFLESKIVLHINKH
jgi:hypothetical protein